LAQQAAPASANAKPEKARRRQRALGLSALATGAPQVLATAQTAIVTLRSLATPPEKKSPQVRGPML